MAVKAKANFVLRQIADEYLIIPLADERDRVHGIIKLNESGARLWECLAAEKSSDDLVCVLCDKYGIEQETAQRDVEEFINQLSEIGCIEKR